MASLWWDMVTRPKQLRVSAEIATRFSELLVDLDGLLDKHLIT